MPFPTGNRQMSDSRIKTLSAAFYNDPLAQFLFPHEESRGKRLSAGLEFLLELSSKTWSAERANKKYAGVVGAAPPKEYPPPFFHLMVVLSKLMWKTLSFMPLGVMKQWLHVFHRVEKMRPLQPHWYILILGVHPDYQGQGLGAELLSPILQKADEESVPVYLETSNPKNLDFYRKFGFEVMEEIVPVRGCPPIRGLVRKPVSELGNGLKS